MIADPSISDSDRYECLMEPSDTWMIWDNRKDEPAMLSGALLMSLDESEARSICVLLNRRSRNDAIDVPANRVLMIG